MKTGASTQPYEVDTFSGSEESDVLHAAGAWMAGEPYAVIIAMNWRWDHPDEDHSLWILDQVVSHKGWDEPAGKRRREA